MARAAVPMSTFLSWPPASCHSPEIIRGITRDPPMVVVSGFVRATMAEIITSRLMRKIYCRLLIKINMAFKVEEDGLACEMATCLNKRLQQRWYRYCSLPHFRDLPASLGH